MTRVARGAVPRVRVAPAIATAAPVNAVVIGFGAWRLSAVCVGSTPTSPTKSPTKACPACFESDLGGRSAAGTDTGPHR